MSFHRWGRGSRSCVLFFALIASAGARVQAQAPVAEVRLVHPDSGTAPSFEVATIKPSNETAQGPRFQLSPTGFKAIHASLGALIEFAYVMKSDDQIVGAPSWMGTEFFDIDAKDSEADVQAAKPLPMDRQMNNLRLRVQSLLAERFQLKTRFETRELPVYALVVAKGGMKMKEVEADAAPEPGSPPRPGAHVPQFRLTGANQYTASAWPMREFAVWLSHFSEVGKRIVVDETGLTGHYDFVLTGVSQQFPEPALLNGSPVDATSIFAALPEQLGLKLEPQKAPVEVLVIESVERPTAN